MSCGKMLFYFRRGIGGAEKSLIRMKKVNFDVSTIIEMTGLSKEEIEKL